MNRNTVKFDWYVRFKLLTNTFIVDMVSISTKHFVLKVFQQMFMLLLQVFPRCYQKLFEWTKLKKCFAGQTSMAWQWCSFSQHFFFRKVLEWRNDFCTLWEVVMLCGSEIKFKLLVNSINIAKSVATKRDLSADSNWSK